MTPEAKAREIALRLVGNPYGIEPFLEFIVQALRDVERETLERAAKLAAEWDLKRTAHEADGTPVNSSAGHFIAHSIRSLLQKEGR